MTRKQLKILIAILSFIIILFAITVIYYFGNNAYRSSKAGVLELNDSNFEEKVLKADEPVLVEFYSNFWLYKSEIWCDRVFKKYCIAIILTDISESHNM